ncbi:MAG: pseudouridine synthase, partial [Candidatus Saccharimonadales bacterium]
MLEPKIIHETKDLLVLDKPAGLAVHAGTGLEKEKTVVDFIKNRVEADGTNRPCIVHRLDKNTSGVLLVA